MATSTRSPYTHIVVHPENEDKNHEVWASFTETHPSMGTFESDALIGWLYPIGPYWVWMNEEGHPTCVFPTREQALSWLYFLCDSIEWLNPQ